MSDPFELKTAQAIAKEMWDTKRKMAHVVHTNHPRMTATHAAAAFCQANSRLLFRSTANGEIVTVEVKGAPAEVLEAAARLDAIARPPEVYPQEVKVSDTKLSSLYNESVYLWRAIDYPDHLGSVPNGKEEVTWEEISGTGTRSKIVIITAKTLAWGLKRASNPDVLHGLDPSRKVLVPYSLDKVNKKLVHELIKDGTNGASLWRLTGIHCAPQFTKDGRVLTVDGFHGDGEGGGCMIALGQLNGLVHADVPLDEAKATVREFIALFPYSGPDDEAVLICLFFAALSRGAFPLAPLFIFDAPRSGTGKTLAAVIISKIAGAVAPVIIPCADGSKDGEAELRKRIETALVTGASGVVLLDDVPRSRVPNPETLRTALSEPSPLMVRKFGKNDEQVPTDPTRVIWVATGNNVGVSDDMVRRCVSCYLDRLEAEKRGWDQQHAFAELRRIVDDPAARAKLLSAALTLLQHNRRERPCRTRDTENYEGWSQVVREAVKFTTGADPWATNVRLAGDDTRAEEHSDVCAALLDITKGEKMELSRIVAEVMKNGLPFQNPFAAVPESVQMMRRIFPCKDANEMIARLGGFLRRHKNKPSSDPVRLLIRQLKPETKRAKALWSIEALDAVPAAFPWQSKQDAAE